MNFLKEIKNNIHDTKSLLKILKKNKLDLNLFLKCLEEKYYNF